MPKIKAYMIPKFLISSKLPQCKFRWQSYQSLNSLATVCKVFQLSSPSVINTRLQWGGNQKTVIPRDCNLSDWIEFFKVSYFFLPKAPKLRTRVVFSNYKNSLQFHETFNPNVMTISNCLLSLCAPDFFIEGIITWSWICSQLVIYFLFAVVVVVVRFSLFCLSSANLEITLYEYHRFLCMLVLRNL